jgi:hypothetical protein
VEVGEPAAAGAALADGVRDSAGLGAGDTARYTLCREYAPTLPLPGNTRTQYVMLAEYDTSVVHTSIVTVSPKPEAAKYEYEKSLLAGPPGAPVPTYISGAVPG